MVITLANPFVRYSKKIFWVPKKKIVFRKLDKSDKRWFARTKYNPAKNPIKAPINGKRNMKRAETSTNSSSIFSGITVMKAINPLKTLRAFKVNIPVYPIERNHIMLTCASIFY